MHFTKSNIDCLLLEAAGISCFTSLLFREMAMLSAFCTVVMESALTLVLLSLGTSSKVS